MKRITIILGAGAELDMSFPDTIMKPTTLNITKKVMEPYQYTIPGHEHDINVVNDINDVLMKNFPTDPNRCWLVAPKPISILRYFSM